MNKPLVNELSKTLGLEMMSIVNVNELREEEEKKTKQQSDLFSDLMMSTRRLCISDYKI